MSEDVIEEDQRIQSSFIEISSCSNFTHQDHLDQNAVKAVGFIRSYWKNNDGSIRAYSSGTAFAVSSKLIITCLHNVYSEKRGTICSEVFFFPGVKEGYLNSSKAFKVTNVRQIKFKRPNSTLNYTPLKEELVLMCLNQSLSSRFALKIGIMEMNELINSQRSQIFIQGYPVDVFEEKQKIEQTYASPKQVSGKIVSIEEHIVNHSMMTSVGFSGGPIIIKDSQKRLVVIGVHTHKGLRPNYNSGIFFNEDLLLTLKKYEQELIRENALTNASIFTSQADQYIQILRRRQSRSSKFFLSPREHLIYISFIPKMRKEDQQIEYLTNMILFRDQARIICDQKEQEEHSFEDMKDFEQQDENNDEWNSCQYDSRIEI